MRVALFVTCLVDQFRPSIAEATVDILERCGCTVEFDARQTCCGQPAFNAGHHQEATPVCRRAVDILDRQLDEGCEAIVTPSGSCASMFRHAVDLLDGDDAVRAARVAASTNELSRFLVRRLELTDLGASWNGRVTWHDACHGLRDFGIRDEPRTLLENVSGLDLVESRTADRCCGFGGTFSVKQPRISAAMCDDKIDDIDRLGVDAVASSDVSCLMQIEGRLESRGSHVRGIHLAELLASREPERLP